jgi:hypothetical protein
MWQELLKLAYAICGCLIKYIFPLAAWLFFQIIQVTLAS